MMPACARRSGLLATLLALLLLASQAAAQMLAPAPASLHPLAPPDTSTPQATLQSFLVNFHDAGVRWLAGERIGFDDPMLARALRTLDLRQIPEANHVERSVEKAFELHGILQRIHLPQMVPANGQEAAAQPALWRIPESEIIITRQDDGPFAGEYLFSAGTVARLGEFYARASGLPVVPSWYAVPGAYHAFRLGPGRGMPDVLVRVINNLPPWAFATFLGEPVWKWAVLAGVVLLALPAIAGMAWLGLHADRGLRRFPVLVRLGQPLAALLTMLLSFLLDHLFSHALRLTGGVLLAATTLVEVVYYLALAWLAYLLATRIGQAIVRAQHRSPFSLDAQLIHLSFRLLGMFAVIWVAVHAADKLGIPVGPLLAGVGVTGLAIALAVRPTMENVIAGFVLFADKPVRVGEFCLFGDKMGTIEAIGLRSTRVRGIDRTVITVPNAEFAQLQIVNFTRRDQMLYNPKLYLRYDTTTEQLRYILAKIRLMLVGHPRVTPDPARVRFTDYTQAALTLDVFAYVNSADFGEYLGIREDLNLRIKDIVEEAGTTFALPAQRIFMAKDPLPDPERTQAVHAEVESWRADSRLPFPDFDAEHLQTVADKLPFPPEGSAAHRKGAGKG